MKVVKHACIFQRYGSAYSRQIDTAKLLNLWRSHQLIGKDMGRIGKTVTWPLAMILDMGLAIMSNCTFIGCLKDNRPMSVNKFVALYVSASCGMISTGFINAAFTYFSKVTTQCDKMKSSWIRNASDLKRHERLSLMSYKPTAIQINDCYKFSKITGLTLTFKVVQYTGKALITFR